MVPDKAWSNRGESEVKGKQEECYKSGTEVMICSNVLEKECHWKLTTGILVFETATVESNERVLGDDWMETGESFLISLRDGIVFGMDLVREEYNWLEEMSQFWDVPVCNKLFMKNKKCTIKSLENPSLKIWRNIESRIKVRTVNRNRFPSWAGSDWWM